MVAENYIATWSDGKKIHEEEISTYDELMDLVDSIGARPETATLLEVYEPKTRRAIGIGIGRDRTVLTYQDSLDPPYYISLGEVPQGNIDTFLYGNEPTEYLSSNLVSLTQGFGVLREFFDTNDRPKTCSWERL